MKKIIILFLLLSSCAGTGSKEMPSVNHSIKKNMSELYFARSKSLIGGGVVANITINGKQVGKLGVGEFLKYEISPGSYSILVEGDSLNRLLMNSADFRGKIKEGERMFFLIEYEYNFLLHSFSILKTSIRTFENLSK